eukprot:14174-Heterococcus_DN1.PRE.2
MGSANAISSNGAVNTKCELARQYTVASSIQHTSRRNSMIVIVETWKKKEKKKVAVGVRSATQGQ